MDVIGTIASVMALVQLTSALIKNVNGHLLRKELGWFEELLITLERTLGELSVAFKESRQKKTSGLIESMNDLQIAVDKGKAVVEEVLSKKNVKVFFLISTYRKKIESVGLEIEKALNGIRRSGVVITVELRESMKETRSLSEELYDKVGEILFDMKENQEDILEQFSDVNALRRLIISNGFAKDEIDLDSQLQSIAQDADFIQSEKEFMDKVILQKVVEISKLVGTQIDENESKRSSKSNNYDHLLTCPLSLDLMEDPVTMNTYTYDRKHLCKSLLTYPNLDPVTNTRFDERASYSNAINIRKLLMQEKGDAAYRKYDDSYFAEAYERAWNNNMDSKFVNPAVPRKRVNEVYQKIDEYLHGLNSKKIDVEKAYETIIDAPKSEYNAILNVWKGRIADPGLSFYKSIRVEKNKSRANAFYRKAMDLDIEGMAEAGDQYAQAHLGLMYQYGYGVDKNYSTAVEWYRKAAEQGHAGAQYYLGNMYCFGQGVDYNRSTAVVWYRKAAKQGHAFAQYNLGEMYQYGLSVNKNHSTAVEWYRKASEQGHAIAQRNLDRLTKSLRKKKIAEE